LKTRDATIRQTLEECKKQGTLSREDEKAAIEKHRAEAFTPREIEILTKSTLSFEFHYLGSAKIVAQIGKAFAEAMVEIRTQRNRARARRCAARGMARLPRHPAYEALACVGTSGRITSKAGGGRRPEAVPAISDTAPFQKRLEPAGIHGCLGQE